MTTVLVLLEKLTVCETILLLSPLFNVRHNDWWSRLVKGVFASIHG